MDSYNEIFRQRTKRFALDIIRLCNDVPYKPSSSVLIKQAVRSGTSIAANYRAMCLGRSAKEKYAKLCIVVEEADETLFWLELLSESGAVSTSTATSDLIKEAGELARVFTAYRSKLTP